MATGKQSPRFETSTLDISKLNEILKMLRLCKFPETKWLQFGLNLRLSLITLSAIEAIHGRDLARCLMECLSKWLTKADDVVGPLTWQTLAAALFELNENTVAEELIQIVANLACQLLQRYNDRLSQVVLPVESVQLLHTEGVISSETLAEVNNHRGLLVGGPLKAIYATVAEDHTKLGIFAGVLQRTKKTELLASEIIHEYDEIFPDSSSSCRGDTANMTTSDGKMRITLNPDHKAKFDKMSDALGVLIQNIAPLIEAAIPLEDFKVFLRRCRPSIKLKLNRAKTFDNVMEIVEGECSVINITLLETIVTCFKIESARKHISAYQTQLDEFCENILTMFCDHQFKRSSTLFTCETIEFVLDWKPDEYSFSNIRGLLLKVFKNNQVEVVVIKEEESITIICYAPHYLMDSLLLLARENLDLLKEMGLMRLTIGYHTVYDQQARDKEVQQLEEEIKLPTKQLVLFKTEKDEHCDTDNEEDTIQEKESQHFQPSLLAEKEREIKTLHSSVKELEEKVYTAEATIADLTKKLQTQNRLTRQKTVEMEDLKYKTAQQLSAKKETEKKRFSSLGTKMEDNGESELKQIPSNIDQLLQSVGVSSKATEVNVSTPDISSKSAEVSCRSLKNIISNPKFKIKVRHALVLFTGLPKSGKSRAFKSFVDQHIQPNHFLPKEMEGRPHSPDDISHYDLIAADSKSWQSFQLTKATKESSCIFGILSAFKQQLLEEESLPLVLLDSKDDKDCFQNLQLNEHIQRIYRYLQSGLLNEECTNFANGLMSIPDEYALVNMWDVPTNNIIHHILLQLQGHLTKNYLCQFLSVEKDLENLQRPPEMEAGGDRSIIMKWRPRLHYLLRSCRLSDSKLEDRRNAVTIFAEHDGTYSDQELHFKINELQDIIKPAAKHTGVSKLLNDRIETVNLSGDLKPLSRNIEEVVSKTQVTEIPIAWLFLRSLLHYSEKRFTCISKKNLVTMAEECGMDDRSLTNFCKFYMSFGSIFDLSQIDPRSEYIIVKPIHFLRMLRSFLWRPTSDEMHQRFPTVKLGIVPEKAGSTVFDEDWPAYENALVCLKLATEVEINRLELPAGINIDPKSKCYYIPLSHTGPLMTEPDPHSVHLITSINTPDVFKEVTLVRKLLKLLPQSKLVHSPSSNQIVIKDYSTGTTVTLVSHGPAVKIHLDEPNYAVCEAIVQVYDEIATRCPVTVKYKFVKMCIEADIPADARYLPSADYHILPNGLCGKCEEASKNDELLKAWNKALDEYPIQVESKPSGQLKKDEKNFFAEKIASSLNIDVIAETFGFPDYKDPEKQPELSEMSGSHLVNELILLWEKKIQKEKGAQEPRRAFARKITELWENSLSRGEVPKGWARRDFVKLANSVDLYYIA